MKIIIKNFLYLITGIWNLIKVDAPSKKVNRYTSSVMVDATRVDITKHYPEDDILHVHVKVRIPEFEDMICGQDDFLNYIAFTIAHEIKEKIRTKSFDNSKPIAR